MSFFSIFGFFDYKIVVRPLHCTAYAYNTLIQVKQVLDIIIFTTFGGFRHCRFFWQITIHLFNLVEGNKTKQSVVSVVCHDLPAGLLVSDL